MYTHSRRSLSLARNQYEHESPILDPYSQQASSKRGYIPGKTNLLQPSDEAAILFCGRTTGPPSRAHWKVGIFLVSAF